MLDEFEREGWLSDARAARQAVLAGSERLGTLRLERDLLARGADAGVVAEALAELRRGDAAQGEAQRARALLRKRFRAAPADVRERARQARFLAGRGFGESVIETILGFEDESEQR